MKRQLRFALLAASLIVLSACTRPLLDEAEMADPIDLAQPLPTVVPVSLQTPVAAPDEAAESAYPAPAPEENAAEAVAAPAEAGEGEPAAPAAEGQTEGVHVVQPGETLGHIAQRYDVAIEEIIAANSISNPDVLEVGQQLVIPAAGTVQVQPTAGAPASVAPPVQSEQIHTVQFGETLFSIGQRYGFTVEQLAAHNGIVNPNQLEVGQQIRIPAQ